MERRCLSLQTIIGISISFAVIAVLIENLLFPNLHTNGVILLLGILTPLLISLVGGIGWLGTKQHLPKRISAILYACLVGVLVIDFLVFALPVFTPGTKVQEQSPFAAHATAPVAATHIPRGPTAQPTQPPQWLGTFDHRAGVDTVAGNVVIGTTDDSKLVLRLENLDAANGPDLYVYLSKDSSPATRAQVMNGLEIGKLTAPRGASNYDIPAGTDITQFNSVVIFCKSFSAIFGYANLSR